MANEHNAYIQLIAEQRCGVVKEKKTTARTTNAGPASWNTELQKHTTTAMTKSAQHTRMSHSNTTTALPQRTTAGTGFTAVLQSIEHQN